MSESARVSSASSSAGSKVLHSVDTVKTSVSHVPGAITVKGAFDGVLDKVGVVSPRSRRLAAYAGVGLLGAAGVVEWPVAAAGAAVVWLTQSRPKGARDAGVSKTEAPTSGGARRSKSRASAKGRATTKPRTAKKATAKAKGTTQSTRRRATTAGSSASTAGG